jgi:TonB-dependent Receptor Plug Domain
MTAATRFITFLAMAACMIGQQPDDSNKDKNAARDLPPVYTQITVTASPEEPGADRRQSEVFTRTLFSRDDQIFHVLESGINAGQHEGGGKSVEIRRFGFNLDHGGVNGGLKVLVDNVQQNQSTQGHGQGYLGSLKTLSPELIQEVTLIDGPFSAEYGDFSGLGVVHIKLRDSLPDTLTLRFQGGSFGSTRGFFGYSPQLDDAEAFTAYEFSRTDGPFINPLNYRRDTWTGHYGRTVSPRDKVGVRFNIGRNDFNSSGQIPLDKVAEGTLDRFGYIDPTDGGRSDSYTGSAYWIRTSENGAVWKTDGFVSRSLFDLFSNFTFFLNDPAARFPSAGGREHAVHAAVPDRERPNGVHGGRQLSRQPDQCRTVLAGRPRAAGYNHACACPRDQWRRLHAGIGLPVQRRRSGRGRTAIR